MWGIFCIPNSNSGTLALQDDSPTVEGVEEALKAVLDDQALDFLKHGVTVEFSFLDNVNKQMSTSRHVTI